MYKKWIRLAIFFTLFAIGLEFFFFNQIWQGTDMSVAYILKSDLVEGRVIQNEDLYAIKISSDEVERLSVETSQNIVGKKLTKDLPAGKLIVSKDFEENSEPDNRETLVLRLDKEQGHFGEMTTGEMVSFLCYRQGEVSTLKELIIRNVAVDQMQVEGMAYYVTVEGESKLLEELLLAKREGSIHILKKRAVHK